MAGSDLGNTATHRWIRIMCTRSQDVVLQHAEALESIQRTCADASDRVMHMGTRELFVTCMARDNDGDLKAIDLVRSVGLMMRVHKRFSSDVTNHAMAVDVTKATMIAMKDAIEPSPRTSKNLRVVSRPTRSMSLLSSLLEES